MNINHNTQPLANLPSALAFRRSVIITDAPFEQGTADGDVTPVPVIRHGMMGTQNVNEGKGKKAAPSAETTVEDAARHVQNPQVIESAKTGPAMTDLRIGFEIKALPLSGALHSCANSEAKNGADAEKMVAMVKDFIERAGESEGLREVSRRIARNICNGRWLWRNRLIASAIRVNLVAGDWRKTINDALGIPINSFEGYSDAEKELGDILASGFRGSKDKITVKVNAVLDLGVTGAVEVYGSQNYEPDIGRSKNDKGGLSRSLYKLPLPDSTASADAGVVIVGQAAFRDAKIWNALRTIDTWFPGYAPGDMPIPVEPQGASLALMRFLRGKEHKKASAFELFKRLNQIDPDSAEGMYCLASLMRGGVFGESEKNRKTKDGTKDGSTEGTTEEDAS